MSNQKNIYSNLLLTVPIISSLVVMFLLMYWPISTENEPIKYEKRMGQERLKAIEDRRKEKINEYDSSSKARYCSKHNKLMLMAILIEGVQGARIKIGKMNLKNLVVLQIGL